MSDSIFEKSIDDELLQLEDMLDIPETIEEEEEVRIPTPDTPEDITPTNSDSPSPSPPPPPPTRKGRKPLSDQRKAELRAQLQKGRASSLAKRKNNAKLRKLKKAKEIVAHETDIILSTKSNRELQDEIKMLKQQMKKSDKNLSRASVISLNDEKILPEEKKIVNKVEPPKIVEENTELPSWLQKELNFSKYYY